MKLKAVKSRIQMTECADIICAGMYCSEPIMTKDDKGEIIDNNAYRLNTARYKM